MPQKQYMYAVSVVAVKDQAVNNQLFSGLADKHSIIRLAKDLVWQFDASFKEDVVMLSCNISEQCAGGMMYRFSFKYPQESVEKCAVDLVSKLEELLD